MFLSNIEGIPKVVEVGILVQPGEVDEVGPVVVDQGVESEPVLPGLREVLDVDVLVAVGPPLAPEQQRLLCRLLLRRLAGRGLIVVDVDLDLLDLEAEDDGPDEAEDHPRVAVHNILGSNILKPHFGVEKGKRFVDIFNPAILDFSRQQNTFLHDKLSGKGIMFQR